MQIESRQGCMLSPMLFLVLIDCVVRIANEGSRDGIQWGFSSCRVEYLDDLDNADDLVVLAFTQAQIRDKTDKVWQAASRVELEVNSPKTKVKRINTTLDTPITVARIQNLFWHAKTNSEPIQTTIKGRRLRWLGHIWRMSH